MRIHDKAKEELNLILCEVLKAGWSVEALAKQIQGINKAKAPDLPYGDDFAIKVLTDAIVTIGQQQAALVERIEHLVGIQVQMTQVGFPIFNPPLDKWPFSKYHLFGRCRMGGTSK